VAFGLPVKTTDGMKTVQVALRDSDQACSLRDLLLRDGAHQVRLVAQPDTAVSGVIVMDIDHLDSSSALPDNRERVVVVASKANTDLTRAWKAGARRVVFYGDDLRTLRVAVLATELTLSADL
jgi:hypothetical protein